MAPCHKGKRWGFLQVLTVLSARATCRPKRITQRSVKGNQTQSLKGRVVVTDRIHHLKPPDTCRTCPGKFANTGAVEPYCIEGPCAIKRPQKQDDVLVTRKSDWDAITGPITFPGENRKKGLK